MSGSGGTILITLIVIGGAVSLWFVEASKFSHDNNLSLVHRSFMPVKCVISSSHLGDSRENSQAYFWQANARVDIQISEGDTKSETHQIVNPEGMVYVWTEGETEGQVSGVEGYGVLSGIAKPNAWFCYPWLVPDVSKFHLPAGVSFH
jgi:hypothetical protein